MTTTITPIEWDSKTQEKFSLMIRKIPMFHREIAKEVVEKKAQINAQTRGASCIEEEDMIDAFFSEVPKAFYSLMIRILDDVGLKYDKHVTAQAKK